MIANKLTLRELMPFPTIRAIEIMGAGKNPDKWGLCLNGAHELTFHEPSEDWVLLFTLRSLYETIYSKYGKKCDEQDIIVYYAIKEQSKLAAPNTGLVVIDFVSISKHRDTITIPEAPKLMH